MFMGQLYKSNNTLNDYTILIDKGAGIGKPGKPLGLSKFGHLNITGFIFSPSF